jgi:hypothetical protein
LLLLTDENFDARIIRGLRRRGSDADIVSVAAAGLPGASDMLILDWAARERRVVLSHDIATMPDQAYDRIRQGLAMPGPVVIPELLALAAAIEELAIVVEASVEGEWEGRVLHLPL